jgi:hypothetical protein
MGEFDLWFEGSKGTVLRPTGDVFACAGLLPAMIKGEPLELPSGLPVDGALLDHLDQLQEIYVAWGGHWGLPLRRIKVLA